jgi:hypothetical protein
MEALREEAFPGALGLDVRHVHLNCEGFVRARLPENLDLLLGTIPIAREGKELEQENPRGAVGRFRLDFGRDGLDRRLELTGLIEFAWCRHGLSSLLHWFLTGVRAVAILSIF